MTTSHTKGQANARLIAAAPELKGGHETILAILGNVDHSRGGGQNSAKMYGGMLEDIRKVSQAAIAKATDQ